MAEGADSRRWNAQSAARVSINRSLRSHYTPSTAIQAEMHESRPPLHRERRSAPVGVTVSGTLRIDVDADIVESHSGWAVNRRKGEMWSVTGGGNLHTVGSRTTQAKDSEA